MPDVDCVSGEGIQKIKMIFVLICLWDSHIQPMTDHIQVISLMTCSWFTCRRLFNFSLSEKTLKIKDKVEGSLLGRKEKE